MGVVKEYYNLRVGDMFETNSGFGLITKVTSKKYYYKVVSSEQAIKGDSYPIDKDRFWDIFVDEDKEKVTIHYSPDMKYRRKKLIYEVQS